MQEVPPKRYYLGGNEQGVPTLNRKLKKVVVGGISSDSGKTVASLCIEAGLLSLGYKVCAFKVGPDFIDPLYHREFTSCFNLDIVMSSESFVKFLLAKYGKEYNVIEGVMGVLDGEKYKGSTAYTSKVVKAPVILCVDASRMGESIRGIVKGFKDEINLAGIIANKVSSTNHIKIIKESLSKEKVALVGYLPYDNSFDFKSRHLGLKLPHEHKIIKSKFEEAFSKYFDKKTVLKIFERSESYIRSDFSIPELTPKLKKIKSIAIITGKFFPFYYPENIMILRSMGFDTFEINEKDIESPDTYKDIGVLIIPGGYPELIGKNEYLISLIRNLLSKPKRVIAECGGLELLSKSIIYKDKKISGIGIFPFEISIEDRLQALGWRKIKIGNSFLKGHEFHYGRISNLDRIKIKRIFRVYDAKGNFRGYDGFAKGKFIATWIHLYFPSSPKAILSLL